MREQDDRGRITFATKKAVKEAIKEALSQKEIDIAINLLNLGLSVEDIAKGTGLTVEQIQKLQDEN